MNKTNHHIYKAEQIDWEKLESVGISRSQIEKDGNMNLLLQGEETNVMSIKIKTPVFSLTMDATLSLIEDENGNPVIFPSEYGHLFYLLLIIYYVLTTLEQETLYL